MTDKSTYFISYNVSTDELEGDLSIQCNPAGTGANKNLKFHPSTTDLSFLKTGNETFSIQKGSSFDTLKHGLLNGEQVNYPAKEFLSTAFSSRPIYDFNVNIKVIASTGSEPLSIFPNALKFHLDHSKGESKSKSVTLSVDSSTVSISAPYWLTVEPIGGNQIEVVTANSAMLFPGIYTGQVIISDNVNQVTIDVIINVIEAEVINELEQYNFCLDENKLYFHKYNLNSKFKKISILGTQDILGNIISFSEHYHVMYFNEKAEIDVGKKIHQFIKRNELLLLNAPLKSHTMKPIKVEIHLEDLDEKFSSLDKVKLGDFYFYPGKRPKCYPLLTNHKFRRRVTGSKLLIPYVEGEIHPFAWGVLQTILNGTHREVSTLKITDENMNFPKKKNFGTVKVVTFPKTKHVIHVQWLNQNYCSEWASFTGEYQVKGSFNHTISRSVFSDKIKKYDSEKEKVIEINTGFILKDEISMIEEMMVSPLAFIELEDRILKCIPNSEKINGEDSTAQLIAFDLQLLIIDEIWK
ncbi:hypothetical protein [Bergeyella zoohelcum]|uniref:hypothetical protein n=1 Tax=Bergeyella zoohelcum TaxID=1015 RepID=UPI003736D07B